MRLKPFTLYVLPWIVLLAATLAVCGACVGLARPAPDPSSDGLNSAEQYAATAIVTVFCPDDGPWYGSAILVSPTQALTAAHVVAHLADCPGAGLLALTFDPMHFGLAEVELYLPESTDDIARVRLMTPIYDIEPAREWRPPTAGSDACAVTGWPFADWKCGRVVATESGRGMDIRLEIPIERGNSGSGLFDMHGHLIGIVTRCGGGGYNGCDGATGRASSITASPQVMP
jgi:hypothetical protein